MHSSISCIRWRRHPFSPEYLSLPPGETVYVTTRQGTVDAVDIRTRAVNQLLTGGVFGPMDYDALTDEVYVPDEKHNLLAVLTPVFAGTALPKEPNRVIHTDDPPESVAITNDGLLGFIALRGGKVVMLDLLHRQIAYTVDVGGTPHFVITASIHHLLKSLRQRHSQNKHQRKRCSRATYRSS